MKLLVAPAHMILKKDYGSELSWSYELIRNLSLLNIDVSAIFNYRYIQRSDDIFKNIEIIILSNKKIIYPNLSEIFIFIIKYFVKARIKIRKENFDLIHHMLPFAYGNTFNLLALFGYTKRIPFIIGPLQAPLKFNETASKNLTFYLLKLANPLLFFLSKKTLEKADVLICINEDSKRLYSKILTENKTIYVIPPGIDIDKFNYAVRKEKDYLEIFCVAYLQKRKGIDLIIKTFAEIIKERPNIHLRIVGIGPEMNTLMHLTNQLNLEKHVIFEGFVPNDKIVKYYQNADIFVSMSYAESFGQTLIEAMATDLPVVATKVGGFKDIIVHGDTGFLIDHDMNELRKNLIRLIDDSELRYRMGQNARKIVEDKYDWKLIAKKYYEIYSNLLCR